jgi:DNA-binding NarL/FixJ family response regulator
VVSGVLDGGAPGRERVEAAAGVLADAGRVIESLGARVRLGSLLAADGFDRDARTVLRDTVETATRIGARHSAGRAHDELVAAGGRMAIPTGDRRDALTATEREVAGLAARGGSNRAIADTLVVSLRTVELHLTHVYRKLAIRSRTELAAALGAHDGPAGSGR